MKKDAAIYIAGHKGMVGSAIHRLLVSQGYTNIITRTHEELDLTDQRAVADFFSTEQPEYVFLAAAKVGGIIGNDTQPADFIYENLQIQSNVIHQSYLHKVKKLLFLTSSCIYPKMAPQPIKEEYLLTGSLEPTNEPFAVAKIAGIKLCQSYNRQYDTNFITVMSSNVYGPNDNFNLKDSHVLPAMIRKCHEGKIQDTPSLTFWGTGSPLREFIHVDDLADACLFLMDNFSPEKKDNDVTDMLINVGTGRETSIKELLEKIISVVDYTGTIDWDTSKPDGTPRKLLDGTHIQRLGWKPHISLEEGLEQTYAWFVEQKQIRGN